METLEKTAELPYLGRTVAFKNSYLAALYENLSKVQRKWGFVVKVLTKVGATEQAWLMINK